MGYSVGVLENSWAYSPQNLTGGKEGVDDTLCNTGKLIAVPLPRAKVYVTLSV